MRTAALRWGAVAMGATRTRSRPSPGLLFALRSMPHISPAPARMCHLPRTAPALTFSTAASDRTDDSGASKAGSASAKIHPAQLRKPRRRSGKRAAAATALDQDHELGDTSSANVRALRKESKAALQPLRKRLNTLLQGAKGGKQGSVAPGMPADGGDAVGAVSSVTGLLDELEALMGELDSILTAHPNYLQLGSASKAPYIEFYNSILLCVGACQSNADDGSGAGTAARRARGRALLHDVEESMQRHAVQADAGGVVAMVKLFADYGESAKALVQIDGLIERAAHRPTLRLFASVLGALCAADDRAGAMALWQRMAALGVMPGEEEHAVMLRMCGRTRDRAALFAVMRSLQRTAMQPTADTVAAVRAAFEGVGGWRVRSSLVDETGTNPAGGSCAPCGLGSLRPMGLTAGERRRMRMELLRTAREARGGPVAVEALTSFELWLREQGHARWLAKHAVSGTPKGKAAAAAAANGTSVGWKRPFDYVLDCPNVGFACWNGKSFNYRQVQLVVERLRKLHDGPLPPRILLMLPRKYVPRDLRGGCGGIEAARAKGGKGAGSGRDTGSGAGGEVGGPSFKGKRRALLPPTAADRTLIKGWRAEEDVQIYCSPWGANDDWFWLMATLTGDARDLSEGRHAKVVAAELAVAAENAAAVTDAVRASLQQAADETMIQFDARVVNAVNALADAMSCDEVDVMDHDSSSSVARPLRVVTNDMSRDHVVNVRSFFRVRLRARV
jgi:hypothetical protein